MRDVLTYGMAWMIALSPWALAHHSVDAIAKLGCIGLGIV